MTRVAAIDCGTNSVRLLITDLTEGRQQDLLREMRIVRLGQGVDETGRLDPAAIERTREALVGYAAACQDHGVQHTRMVATSASRDATNRADFVAMVREVLGVDPEVISGAEEAALSFAGATYGLDPAAGPFAVIDIGGGSTEVVLGSAAPQAALSVDVGCVRLTERRLPGDPPTAEQVAAAEADVAAALERVAAAVPVSDARTAVGLAGSVTTLAALSLGLDRYDRDRVHLSVLTRAEVERWTARLLAMTRAERAALPVMHPGRVDVIGAGALVLRAVMARFDLSEVLVSEADILDGIAWSTAEAAA